MYFKAGMLGFNINGRFSSSYSNYNFNPTFDKNTFGKEILSFSKEATKKDSVYWIGLRPVPLTKEEVTDYKIKDSIKVIRKSKKIFRFYRCKKKQILFVRPIIWVFLQKFLQKVEYQY